MLPPPPTFRRSQEMQANMGRRTQRFEVWGVWGGGGVGGGGGGEVFVQRLTQAKFPFVCQDGLSI